MFGPTGLSTSQGSYLADTWQHLMVITVIRRLMVIMSQKAMLTCNKSAVPHPWGLSGLSQDRESFQTWGWRKS